MKKRYITLKDGGCDFRKMAKIMSRKGYKMNHATARNQLILGLESLITHTALKLKIRMHPGQIKKMIADQNVQNQMADVLFLAWEALTEEERENAKKENK